MAGHGKAKISADMSWLHILQGWDGAVFQWINGSLGNPVFDAVLPCFREKWFWAPLYLFIGAFCWLNFGRKGWVIVLGLALSVGISDFTSSSLVKKNIQRLRPCNDPALAGAIHLRISSCGSGYSFTSSHAANHFAVAVFLIGVFGGRVRWLRPAALAWAAAIAFSQVYVGVHYPGDVVCGGLLGAAAGGAVGASFSRLGWLARLQIAGSGIAEKE